MYTPQQTETHENVNAAALIVFNVDVTLRERVGSRLTRSD